MIETITDAFWAQLLEEATAIRWVMFSVGAQPTKSDVEDALMSRHGLDRHWPHLAMNHLEQHDDVLHRSMRCRSWQGKGDEPQLAPDILEVIKKKARKRPLIRRTLTPAVLEALAQ